MHFRSLIMACAVLPFIAATVFGQSRDYRAERLVLDDGNGNTVVIQTPAGPITGGTLTIPDPGGAGQFLITNPSGGTQSVSGNMLPGADDTYDLGSGASRWQDIFSSGNVQAGGQVQYVETGGGTDYVGFQAPAAVTANQIWTLPAADGTSGQTLITDGSGVLSWATAGGTVSTNASLTGDGSGGSLLGINLANSNTWTATQEISGTGTTGLRVVNTNIDVQNNDNAARQVRLFEPSSSGSNFSAFRAAAQSSDITYTLPPDDGDNGEVLTTDGTGTLSWASAGGGTVTTNTTLTGDGSGGSPLGINLNTANTWTGWQTFTNAFTEVRNGRLVLTNNDNNGRDIRWQEPSGGGSQYVGFRSPVVPRNSNYVFPDTIGAPGDVLAVATRNGFLDSATLEWVTPTGGGTVTTNGTLTGDGSGGSPLGIDLTNANSWTGTQTFSSAEINGGTIDGTTIGATTESTGRFSTVEATTVLGSVSTPAAGTTYRDNVVIAWGDVAAAGIYNDQFGNAVVIHTPGTGTYTVALPNAPTAAATTVTLQSLGFVTVTRAGSVLTITTYDTLQIPTDLDFYYVMVGRP